MAKQDNYKDLLSKVGTFARNERNDPEAGDALSSAHLASWAFGDRKVLEATNAFQRRADTETLVSLLEAVRDSLGYKDDLPEDFTRNPNRYDPTVLFPGGDKPVGGLRQPSPESPSKEKALQEQQEQITQQQKALQEQQEQITQQLAQVTLLLSSQAQQAPHETGASGSPEREPETGRNRTAYLTKRLSKREAADRGHASSHIDAQPHRSPQVDASEDTETRKSPAPGNGGESDIRHAAGEEKQESTSRPVWKRILGIS
jgi:hypothetical protein